jgi:two-component system OmpR family response regulator
MKILAVEDEQKLAEALKSGLQHQGHAVDIIHDGAKALTRISLHRKDYDLMILDLMLPSLDGREICRQAREMGITVPILILTARSDMETKVAVLLSGADDYLVKPFAFEELSARIQALLRRPHETLPQKLVSGALTLDPSTHTVTQDEQELTLTLKEYGLLEYFMRHPNQVVNREDLLTHLWDFNYAGFSNVVDVHIKNLRRKLRWEDALGGLETVRGIGYRLRD